MWWVKGSSEQSLFHSTFLPYVEFVFLKSCISCRLFLNFVATDSFSISIRHFQLDYSYFFRRAIEKEGTTVLWRWCLLAVQTLPLQGMMKKAKLTQRKTEQGPLLSHWEVSNNCLSSKGSHHWDKAAACRVTVIWFNHLTSKCFSLRRFDWNILL